MKQAATIRFSIRSMLIVGLLALGACVHSASDPTPTNSDINVTGRLTLKGSDPFAWWAVTDELGQVWKITSPTPEQVSLMARTQNQKVKVVGKPDGKYLSIPQVQPSRISVLP
jgi:hypothetical protein